MKLKTLLIISVLTFLFAHDGYTQIRSGDSNASTAGLFMTLNTLASSSAVSQTGVATSDCADAVLANPAKLGFCTDKAGISISYTPWLRALVGDMDISAISSFIRWNDKHSFGLSLNSFAWKQLSAFGTDQFNNDWAITAAYSYRLSQNWALGTNLNYMNISSYLYQNNLHKAYGFSGSMSVNYRKTISLLNRLSVISVGSAIRNIGAKVRVANDDNGKFLPTDWCNGVALLFNAQGVNQIEVSGEMKKWLFPDSEAHNSASTFEGLSLAFNDGGDWSPAIANLSYSIGMVYSRANRYFVRSGWRKASYFPADTKHLTFGFGYRINTLNFDVTYYFPSKNHSPVDDTIQFTLGCHFK